MARSATTSRTTTAPKRKQRGRAVILLIEDEPLLVSLYASALVKLTEAKVLTATEEEEALRLINSVVPRLILLDLMIPATSGAASDFHEPIGFDVLRRVKKNPKTREIHVVILSNLDADEHRQHAHDLGAEEYIVKALLKPRELVARIAKYLGTS